MTELLTIINLIGNLTLAPGKPGSPVRPGSPVAPLGPTTPGVPRSPVAPYDGQKKVIGIDHIDQNKDEESKCL